MKLLVASDTHGNAAQLRRMLEKEAGAQALIFLGDGLRDLTFLDKEYPALRVYPVRGNCDYSCFEPAEGLAAFDGLLFFYTHGHGYEVKWTLTPIKAAARQRGAEVVLFGHTHTPYYEYENGLYIFNPGSLGHPRAGKPTYGVITNEKGRPRFEHREL